MNDTNHFDVIVVGGSYAGLSAAMALGRSLRKVLVIDGGEPCNRQTPHSHNFLTQDGEPPSAIAGKARAQLHVYNTVRLLTGLATAASRDEHRFALSTAQGETFSAAKLVLATGIRDLLPPIEGFADCWGISVIHCPYCHGYEVRNRPTGILANGDTGFEFAKMIHHWTKALTIFTNGAATFTSEQKETLVKKGIPVVEKEVFRIEHRKGYLENLLFADGSKTSLHALYARPAFEQQGNLARQLGCALTEAGHIQVDGFQKTTTPGVFACGDNSSLMRAVSVAVASGTMAGAMCNKELIEEQF